MSDARFFVLLKGGGPNTKYVEEKDLYIRVCYDDKTHEDFRFENHPVVDKMTEITKSLNPQATGVVGLSRNLNVVMSLMSGYLNSKLFRESLNIDVSKMNNLQFVSKSDNDKDCVLCTLLA